MLRIDVDSTPQPPLAYAIPPDNPFVNETGVDEIYAYGFRNPFKFSFDDGPGGDGSLFLGDVGQDVFEEVNIVEKGENYGWVIKEGFSCFDPFNPEVAPTTCANSGPLGEPLVDPIVSYAQAEGGLSVIGGFVYRGSRSPGLLGKYVFGDFSDAFGVPGGRLYYLDGKQSTGFVIKQFQIGSEDLPYGLFLKGIGEDEDGELYTCGSTALAPFGDTGVVQRIVVESVSSKGDLNNDQCIDRADYTLLINEIRNAASPNEANDLNGDGSVNRADARALINLFSNPRGASCN